MTETPIAHDVEPELSEAALERAAKRKDAELIAKYNLVIKQLLATPDGRAWVMTYFKEFRIFQTTWSRDSSATAFAEGSRAVALKLLADVTRAAPDEYLIMLKEDTNNEPAA